LLNMGTALPNVRQGSPECLCALQQCVCEAQRVMEPALGWDLTASSKEPLIPYISVFLTYIYIYIRA
jgi:hypothetical protein